MPDDNEIQQAARDLIDRYGSDALHQTEIRMDELQRHGNKDAYAMWDRIYHVVEELSEESRLKMARGKPIHPS